MKYKVGDKVRIREDLVEEVMYGCEDIVPEMLKCRGQVAEIVDIYNGRYELDIDSGVWDWTDEMFESVTPDVRFPAFQEQPDNVNHPAHSKHGEIETLDIIRMSLTPEEFQGFLKGNVLKYQLRAPFKHATPEEDYKKAKYYYDEYREEAE